MRLRPVLIVLLFLAVLVVGLYAFAYMRFDAIAETMIFPGAWAEKLAIAPESAALGAYAVALPAGEDTVSVLVLPSDTEPRRAIVYAHGNGEHLSGIQGNLRTLHDMGFTVVAYDYPGYGESTGQPGAESIRLAIRSVLSYVHGELAIPQERTVYGGYSLGTAASMVAASIERPERIFLLAPFASDRDVAASYIGFDIYGLLGRAAYFPSDEVASGLDVPVFIAHGRADATIDYSLWERLFAAFPDGHKKFLTLPEGTTHYFAIADEPLRGQLEAFLNPPATIEN